MDYHSISESGNLSKKPERFLALQVKVLLRRLNLGTFDDFQCQGKVKKGTVLLQYFPSGANKLLIEHTTKQFNEITRGLPQKKLAKTFSKEFKPVTLQIYRFKK